MKHFFTLCLAVFMMAAFSSCNTAGDNIPELAGKSFTYSNGEIGILRHYEVYEFDTRGGVYNYRSLGNSLSFDTDGCDLYYTLNGNELVIYHGVKGWKKEVRHTVYASGYYYGNYIVIDGNEFHK